MLDVVAVVWLSIHWCVVSSFWSNFLWVMFFFWMWNVECGSGVYVCSLALFSFVDVCAVLHGVWLFILFISRNSSVESPLREPDTGLLRLVVRVKNLTISHQFTITDDHILLFNQLFDFLVSHTRLTPFVIIKSFIALFSPYVLLIFSLEVYDTCICLFMFSIIEKNKKLTMTLFPCYFRHSVFLKAEMNSLSMLHVSVRWLVICWCHYLEWSSLLLILPCSYNLERAIFLLLVCLSIQLAHCLLIPIMMCYSFRKGPFLSSAWINIKKMVETKYLKPGLTSAFLESCHSLSWLSGQIIVWSMYRYPIL